MTGKDVKLTFLGMASVGKTSLLTRMSKDVFEEKSPPTIGAVFVQKDVTYKGDLYRFSLWDTAGSEQYSVMTPMYYRDANVAVIVADLTDEKSFDVAANYIDSVRKNHARNISCVIVLVGNKCDEADSKRVKTPEQFADFATNHIVDIYKETSAKTGHNIKELLDEIYEAVSNLSDIQQSNAIRIGGGDVQRSRCC